MDAVSPASTIGTVSYANLFGPASDGSLMMGSLLVMILIASAIDAVTRAAGTNAMECFSPLDIVGLDNCPELNSNGGRHNNSIVQNLLAAKADMLRQVSQTIR